MFCMPKPLSQRLYDRHLSNMPFASHVVPIETNDPAVELIERVQPTLQQRLLDLPIADPELKKRRQEIISGLSAFTLQADELLAEVAEQRTESLENELETIRARGREQERIVASRKSDHERKVMNLRQAREQVSALTERFETIRSTKLSKWDGKAERQAHDRKIEAAKEQLRLASAEVVSAGHEQQEAWRELGEAQEAMKKISDAEFRCRGQLSGQAYRDPEFGLTVSPTI